MIAKHPLGRSLVLLVFGVVGCSSSFGGGTANESAPMGVEICEDGVFHAARGLSPARATDYVSLRHTFGFKGGTTDTVLDQDGFVCKDSVAPACQEQVDGMSLGSGWPQPDGSFEYLLVTVKDDVIVYPSTEAVLTLLGTIDTAHEAALLARTRGLVVDCEQHPQAYAVDDSFRVLSRRGNCVDAVIVKPNGEMTIERNVKPGTGCEDDIDAGGIDGGDIDAGEIMDAEIVEDASPPPDKPF